jgi:NTE family protein
MLLWLHRVARRRNILSVLTVECNRTGPSRAVRAVARNYRPGPLSLMGPFETNSAIMRQLVLLLSTMLLLGACALPPAGYNGAGAPSEAAIAPLRSERPLIALALGGGGARGFAHIGVIKALEEAGIEADIVTGASSGAIVAALYAGGRGGRELEEIARATAESDLLDIDLFGSGWVRGVALQDFVNRMVDKRPIERLPKPFAVIATEARSGRMTVFNRGNTGVAVRASSSIPRVFVPPVINGEEYVDGGLSGPVPVKVARAMGADIVIAVDVSYGAQARQAARVAAPGYRGNARHALFGDQLDAADIVIVPRTVRVRMLDFEHKETNIAAGEAAGREAVPQLRKLLLQVTASKTGERYTVTSE